MIALQTYLIKPVLDKIFIGKDMKLPLVCFHRRSF